ncbi:MAG: prepilin-type N-terminal cleavage/methylation domain-containing protein [Roseimicrobium sp.]
MRHTRRQAGFTAAEMLVATAMAAVLVGAAALAYSTIVRGQRQLTQVATVRLPAGAQLNYYGINSTNITTYVAPNFGSVARAESLRERFIADVAQSIAVYCLYRRTNVLNTVRPTSIPSPAYGVMLDTPETFRTYLASAVPASSSVFASYRNFGTITGANATPNFTIFILGYSANATTIPVLAVYDLDIVQATNPNATTTVVGHYVALRRYVAGQLTGYYDVMFPVSAVPANDLFIPSIVAFERRSRMAVAEGSSVAGWPDRFKVAKEQPFYFVFWPDPGLSSLALPDNAQPTILVSGVPTVVLNGSYPDSDPRRAYNHMAGRTSFMFTVPMFPSS